MKASMLMSLLVPVLIGTGCANLPSVTRTPPPAPVPCTYRFKMLSRPEDQARVEAAIRSVAYGPVSKSGTLSYPEYRFHVARLADLDRLQPKLLYAYPGTLMLPNRKQTLNLKRLIIDATFDSTDVSASATTTLSFTVKPGSRLYFKHPGGVESDITAKVDKKGKVSFPVAIKDGQKYIYARAVKDSVVRYIRINLFTNSVQDISRREY